MEKRVFMQKVFKFFGITAIAVIFLFMLTACGGGGGSSAKDFNYALNKAGNGVIILDYIGKKGGNLVIPAKIEGYPVVQIKTSRYEDEYISSYGFKERTKSDIEKEKRSKNPDLRVSVISHGRKDRITSIVIPDTVTYIGESAFENCEDLKKVTLPKNLKIIGDSAFRESGLTSIVIPEGVTQIGEYHGMTFFVCENLTSVTLLESLVEIFQATFMGCKELTTVKLPSGTIKYVDNREEGERVRTIAVLSDVSRDIVLNPNNDAFQSCPKLSLAVRKAITASGYGGKF